MINKDLKRFTEFQSCTPDGFGGIALVDVMGSDSSIVRAARTSYGKGTKAVRPDRGLIRYLMRNHHSTPFEMCEIILFVRVPMDTWRQWIRHRTACLSGDTRVQFDLPGGIKRRGNQCYTLTMEEIYNKFQPTFNSNRPNEQRNPYHKRDRVKQMKLRGINEDSGKLHYTKVVDIWKSGVKDVYKIELLNNNSCIECSKDHLIMTGNGWKKLEDLCKLPINHQTLYPKNVSVISIGPGISTGIKPSFVKYNDREIWEPIVNWEEYYEVSNHGNVRRIGKDNKKLTNNNGRLVVSLNRPGEQITQQVHRLVLEAFDRPPLKNEECCHNDGNSFNNHINNLRWDTAYNNAQDRIRDDATTHLKINEDAIFSIKHIGKKETYDMEVEGPYHNFSANGIIVHNSVNEYSTRYSEAIDEMATTPQDEWRLQSGSNKQGSDGKVHHEWTQLLSVKESELHRIAREVYQERLDMGVAREQARKDLPLSNYTQAYWKIDLHNLLHFLRLRLDSHAQLEIRRYAQAIAEIVRVWVPHTWEAFEDYRLLGCTLSRMELEIIYNCIRVSGVEPITIEKMCGNKNMSKREINDFLEKLYG